MSDYPDPDEEFELMYGDDLDLLRSQDCEDGEIHVLPAPSVRKSLDFSTPSKDNLKSQKKTTQENQSTDLDASFHNYFQNIQNDDNIDEMVIEEEPRRNEETESSSPAMRLDIEQSNSKKRTVEDLFGDVNDIFDDDFFEDVSEAKRHKGDEKVKHDLELIDLILRKRQEHKLSHKLTTVTINQSETLNNVERDKRNMSYQVPKYPFIKIKTFHGDSVYVRFHSEDYEKDEMKRIMSENSYRGVLGDNFRKIWNEAENILKKEPVIEQQPTVQDIEMFNEPTEEKQLWVDLYKPRKYLELLSDESINRTMLRWMKLWDKVVFNRNPKIKVQNESQKKFFNINELNTTLDEYGRPAHKVALLCGPPGLGKTTLAHTVAKHAGYNVIEINASDDRSTDAFRTALENATQMRSVVDQERRPNCLVFDEIDGAPQSSIEFLIKFITGTAPKKGKKIKNNSKSQTILKRPIICICNDVYVPALRPLRQIAFVINFPQTSSARLTERLMEIARRQQIKTGLGAMVALAEKSNNDIRSCLSVLHFFKSQNKPIGLIDIYKTNIGQKDMQKGLFAVWNEIFEIQRIKKASGGSSIATIPERMQKILNTMSCFGDHERVAQGVYENFPDLVKDSSLEGTLIALDWFCFNDIVSKQIYAVQNYSLMSYLNYAFVVWHFVFSTFQKPKLKYPSAGYEFRVKETRQKATVAEALRGMAPSVRCYNAVLPLIIDVLPLLLRIISPSFRPVSLHLYSEEERKNLLRVASIMTDYNLNYIQERMADGVYQYNLEPNVEELVIFDKADDRRKILSYSNRQLIAREIEIEKMRRFEVQIAKIPKAVNDGNKEKNKVDNPVNTQKQVEAISALPNHLQTLKSSVRKNASTTKQVITLLSRLNIEITETSSALKERNGHFPSWTH